MTDPLQKPSSQPLNIAFVNTNSYVYIQNPGTPDEKKLTVSLQAFKTFVYSRYGPRKCNVFLALLTVRSAFETKALELKQDGKEFAHVADDFDNLLTILRNDTLSSQMQQHFVGLQEINQENYQHLLTEEDIKFIDEILANIPRDITFDEARTVFIPNDD